MMHLRRWFGIHEIESSLALQWVAGALVLIYFLTFSHWISSGMITVQTFQVGHHLCWPYFQSCGEWYFLQNLPSSYLQNTFYMGFFAVLLGTVYAMYRRWWGWVHAGIGLCFVWKAIVVLFLTMKVNGNYEYYHLLFSLVYLLLPHKEFFLKFSIVWFYFLSTMIKLHPGWIAGTYFSTLKIGLPFVPFELIPVATHIVILMEMVGAWFLLAKPGRWQLAALLFFLFFHLYSGLLVSYRYPATVLPMVLILFGMFYRWQKPPLDTKSLWGWSLMLLLLGGQLISHLIPGDEKRTMEGNFYGLYMFEGNHQCQSEYEIFYKNDQPNQKESKSSQNARSRCDVYREWFRLQQVCQDPDIDRITWQNIHSLNGEPFYLRVNTTDACALGYRPFSRNPWIQTPADGAPIVGIPYRNEYR